MQERKVARVRRDLAGAGAMTGPAPALRGGASFGGIAPALRGGAMSIGGIAPALRGGAMSIVALGATTVPAVAQDAAEERAQSFQAVEGAVKEDVPGGPLLVIAYGVIWALVLLYLIRLVRLQQRAQSDVQRLEQVLARTPSRDAAG